MPVKANEYSVAHKKVDRTGVASFGWQLGYGYVCQAVKVSSKQWCVLRNKKVFVECRSEAGAKEVKAALELAALNQGTP